MLTCKNEENASGDQIHLQNCANIETCLTSMSLKLKKYEIYKFSLKSRADEFQEYETLKSFLIF